MLQRDYFLRLIEEFQATIGRFLEKKENDRRDDDIRELYRQYVGDYDVVRNLSFDELMAYAQERWQSQERMDRLHFAAELLYAEAFYKGKPLRDLLLGKAYKLYAYLEAHSDVMSLDRRQKMGMILSETGGHDDTTGTIKVHKDSTL